METDRALIFGLVVLGTLAFNFVPTFVAFARQHPERAFLAKLNVLSLLSFLLWFALLVWAVGGKRNDGVIGRFVGSTGNRGKLTAIVAVLVGVGVASTAYALTRG